VRPVSLGNTEDFFAPFGSQRLQRDHDDCATRP
jgi:hypothetical protein